MGVYVVVGNKGITRRVTVQKIINSVYSTCAYAQFLTVRTCRTSCDYTENN